MGSDEITGAVIDVLERLPSRASEWIGRTLRSGATSTARANGSTTYAGHCQIFSSRRSDTVPSRIGSFVEKSSKQSR